MKTRAYHITQPLYSTLARASRLVRSMISMFSSLSIFNDIQYLSTRVGLIASQVCASDPTPTLALPPGFGQVAWLGPFRVKKLSNPLYLLNLLGRWCSASTTGLHPVSEGWNPSWSTIKRTTLFSSPYGSHIHPLGYIEIAKYPV